MRGQGGSRCLRREGPAGREGPCGEACLCACCVRGVCVSVCLCAHGIQARANTSGGRLARVCTWIGMSVWSCAPVGGVPSHTLTCTHTGANRTPGWAARSGLRGATRPSIISPTSHLPHWDRVAWPCLTGWPRGCRWDPPSQAQRTPPPRLAQQQTPGLVQPSPHGCPWWGPGPARLLLEKPSAPAPQAGEPELEGGARLWEAKPLPLLAPLCPLRGWPPLPTPHTQCQTLVEVGRRRGQAGLETRVKHAQPSPRCSGLLFWPGGQPGRPPAGGGQPQVQAAGPLQATWKGSSGQTASSTESNQLWATPRPLPSPAGICVCPECPAQSQQGAAWRRCLIWLERIGRLRDRADAHPRGPQPPLRGAVAAFSTRVGTACCSPGWASPS